MADDPLRYVVLLAFVLGIVDLLTSAALDRSTRAGWGALTLVLAVFLGPLVSLAYYGIFPPVAAAFSRLLGGSGGTAETRAALVWGRLPELLALPLWAGALWLFGEEVFTQERPLADAHPGLAPGLDLFVAVLVALWLWSALLRLLMLAEVQGFSVPRAFLALILAMVLQAAVFVGLLVGLMAAFP